MTKISDYKGYLTSLFAQLDAYLLKDLETLVKEIPPRENGGGVGYPSLHTILSGMELLGLISSSKQDTAAFKFYWENYLCKIFPQYNTPGLMEIFRGVMRNGTAHLFLVKSGVSVSKENKYHLVPVDYNGSLCLNIDLIILHEHFIQTYNAVKQDLLTKQLTPDTIAGCEFFNQQMLAADKEVQDYLKANFTLTPTNPVIFTSANASTMSALSASTSTSSSVVNPAAPTFTPPQIPHSKQ